MPETQPSTLFKYRDDSERTEEIITRGSVWLSTVEKLNDPLECKTGDIPEDWKREQILELENAQLSGFVMSALPALDGNESFYSLSNWETRKWFKRFKRLRSHEGKYASMRSFFKRHKIVNSLPSALFENFERQLADVGIFSLSESADIPLMWAHYGASHTGIAIGFKRTANSKLGSDQHCIKVNYDDARPTFDKGFINQISFYPTANGGLKSAQKIGFNDLTFRAAFGTKPLTWTYEQEWRYVEETNGVFPAPGPIAEVVFGLKMPEARRTHYAAIVDQFVKNNVAFFAIEMTTATSSLSKVPWLRPKP